MKMGIREAAKAKDEVGLGREAVSISEGNEGNRRLAPRSMIAEGTDQQSSKVMNRETARIDDPVRLSLELRHPLPLQTDPFKN